MSASMLAEGVLPAVPADGGSRASREPSAVEQAITVVMACDGNYAMPLATAIRSIVEARGSGPALHIHVLVDDFPPALQARVQASIPAGAATIEWLPVSLQGFAGFQTLPGISKMTYARLLIQSLLPPEVHRVLYIDVDVLVLDDLAALWATPLEGCVIGAVTDGLDAELKSGEALLLGLPKVKQYFNAGMLLIDLDRWREARISERAVQYLIEHPKSAYSDQDALNVACDGQWLSLNPRWNFQQHLSTRPEQFAGAQRPGLVHFVTGRKPWLAQSASRHARLYDAYRARTCFARSRWEVARDGLVGITMPLRPWLKRIGVLRTLHAALKQRRAA